MNAIMESTSSIVQIKGIRDGLLATFAGASWEEQRDALAFQINERSAFFQGARLAMDVGTQVLKVNDLVELRDWLSEKNITLWAVVSESPTTENSAQLLGLATRISKPRPEEARHVLETIPDDMALFVSKTVRSGTRIEFPGNVVVYGDVNPGAEIIADGNVIVWGRVRGVIHAGAKGDREAFVCALDLSANQLRIAEESSAVLKPQKDPRPEVASINKEGKLQAELWHPGEINSRK
ncbi:MAG: septum site-determining protein MinC [Chloroflexi bacterium]|nr:septum site-determining protein MinC [Chloroflexi bacterium CFX1]MCK6568427.1 septum site-determining protein MinC [Anaerolineales bacterium]MCQ3953921.1 septum site-determining protein MinC [Chloroflexota bacterium]NUQ58668.1 septum site-determining protein MinC [Anaerolineales bacterium]RIK55429.1 MAG: septum site-determining protein MinC [Chloroflexota bacterium]